MKWYQSWPGIAFLCSMLVRTVVQIAKISVRRVVRQCPRFLIPERPYALFFDLLLLAPFPPEPICPTRCCFLPCHSQRRGCPSVRYASC